MANSLEDSEIFFAIPSFKWSNNAKKQAGVYCVIIGISKDYSNDKNIKRKSVADSTSNKLIFN